MSTWVRRLVASSTPLLLAGFAFSSFSSAAPAPAKKAVRQSAPSRPAPAAAAPSTPPPPAAPTAAAAPLKQVQAAPKKAAIPPPEVSLREVEATGRLVDTAPATQVSLSWEKWPAEKGRALSPPSAEPTEDGKDAAKKEKKKPLTVEAVERFPTVRFTVKTEPKSKPQQRKGLTRFVEQSKDLFTYETRELNGTLELLDPSEAKGAPPKKHSLIFAVSGRTPHLLVDSSCEDRGLFLDPRLAASARFPQIPYVGISCSDGEGSSIDLALHLPQGAKASNTDLGVPYPKLAKGKKPAPITGLDASTGRPRNGEPIWEGRDWKVYRLPEPPEGWSKLGLAGVVEIADATGQKADFAVTIDPSRIPSKRFSGSFGLAVTAMRYSEQPAGIHLFQLPLTAKGQLNIELLRKYLELHLSAYGNIVNFTKDPSTTSDARFIGINLRTDFIFPIPVVKLKLGLGWYVWTMLGDGSYGIRYLTGPEAMLNFSFPVADRRLGIYYKFAPISGSPGSIGFRNYEMAAGLFAVVTPPTFYPGIMLNVDASMLRIDEIQGAENRLQLYTVSFGPTLLF
jgi:hypothetical protein